MTKRSPSLKRIAVFLAGIILFQATLADAATAIWQERRQKRTAAPQLASLAIPAAAPVSALGRVSSAGAPAPLRARLSSVSLALPATLGRLEARTAPARATSVVVVIHDVHRNAEAQKNIGGAVSSLLDRGLISALGLEGASDAIALEPFRAFPHAAATRTAADHFLASGQLSGAAHAALTGARALPPIVGLEEKVLYDRNVAAVRDAEAVRHAAVARLDDISAGLALRKATTFSPALRSLDASVSAYHAGTLGLGDHLAALRRAAGAAPANVTRFLSGLELENRLSFPQVEKERGALIEALARKLSAHAAAGLAAATLAYRAGNTSHAEFYAALESVAAAHGIALSRYPALAGYLRYVALIDAIDAEALLSETDTLEESVYARSAASDDERALVRESRRLALSRKLVSFALTSAEWAAYRRLAAAGAPVRLTPFEDFYRAAQARDEALVSRLLAAMADGGPGVGVMVAGGFHAGGVRRLLEERGVAVVGFVPRVTKADVASGGDYLTAFTREKTPIEKIFSGEKLFLAQPPVAAELTHLLPAAQIATRLLTAPTEETALAAWYRMVRSERGWLESVSTAGSAVTMIFLETVDGSPHRITEKFTFDRDLLTTITSVDVEAPTEAPTAAPVVRSDRPLSLADAPSAAPASGTPLDVDSLNGFLLYRSMNPGESEETTIYMGARLFQARAQRPASPGSKRMIDRPSAVAGQIFPIIGDVEGKDGESMTLEEIETFFGADHVAHPAGTATLKLRVEPLHQRKYYLMHPFTVVVRRHDRPLAFFGSLSDDEARSLVGDAFDPETHHVLRARGLFFKGAGVLGLQREHLRVGEPTDRISDVFIPEVERLHGERLPDEQRADFAAYLDNELQPVVLARNPHDMPVARTQKFRMPDGEFRDVKFQFVNTDRGQVQIWRAQEVDKGPGYYPYRRFQFADPFGAGTAATGAAFSSSSMEELFVAQGGRPGAILLDSVPLALREGKDYGGDYTLGVQIGFEIEPDEAPGADVLRRLWESSGEDADGNMDVETRNYMAELIDHSDAFKDNIARNIRALLANGIAFPYTRGDHHVAFGKDINVVGRLYDFEGFRFVGGGDAGLSAMNGTVQVLTRLLVDVYVGQKGPLRDVEFRAHFEPVLRLIFVEDTSTGDVRRRQEAFYQAGPARFLQSIKADGELDARLFEGMVRARFPTEMAALGRGEADLNSIAGNWKSVLADHPFSAEELEAIRDEATRDVVSDLADGLAAIILHSWRQRPDGLYRVRSSENASDALTLDLSRWTAGKLGLDPAGFTAEVIVAPVVEGAFLLHFIPWFPLMHKQRSWHQGIGMAMIYGFAIAGWFAAQAMFGVDMSTIFSTPVWPQVAPFIGGWLDGIIGHAAYNALARAAGWSPLTLPTFNRLETAKHLPLVPPGQPPYGTTLIMRGDTLVSHDANQWVRVFVETNGSWRLVADEVGVRNVQINDAGDVIVVNEADTGRLIVLTLHRGGLRRHRIQGWGEKFVLSPDGNTLMAMKGRIVTFGLVYPAGVSQIARFTLRNGPPVEISRDGRRAAIQIEPGGSVNVHDLWGRGRIIGRPVENVQGFEFSADGTVLAVRRRTGRLGIFHVTDDARRAVRLRLTAVASFVDQAVEKGALLWVTHVDGRKSLVRIVDGKAANLGNPFGKNAKGLQVSRDGRVAAADVDGQVTVFRLDGTAFRPIGSLPAHDTFNAQFSLSQDGRTIAHITPFEQAGAIHRVEAAGLRPLGSRMSGPFSRVAITPDGGEARFQYVNSELVQRFGLATSAPMRMELHDMAKVRFHDPAWRMMVLSVKAVRNRLYTPALPYDSLDARSAGRFPLEPMQLGETRGPLSPLFDLYLLLKTNSPFMEETSRLHGSMMAETPPSLTLPFVRAAAQRLGLDPRGAATEIGLAPLIEGGLLIHFLPWFPLMHKQRSWHQWIGMAFIYGAAIGAAFVFGHGFSFEWTSLLSAYLGGIAGHSTYNGLARTFGWARLSTDRTEKTLSATLEGLRTRFRGRLGDQTDALIAQIWLEPQFDGRRINVKRTMGIIANAVETARLTPRHHVALRALVELGVSLQGRLDTFERLIAALNGINSRDDRRRLIEALPAATFKTRIKDAPAFLAALLATLRTARSAASPDVIGEAEEPVDSRIKPMNRSQVEINISRHGDPGEESYLAILKYPGIRHGYISMDFLVNEGDSSLRVETLQANGLRSLSAEKRLLTSQWNSLLLGEAITYARAHGLQRVYVTPPLAQYLVWTPFWSIAGDRIEFHPASYVAQRHYSNLPNAMGFHLIVRAPVTFSHEFPEMVSRLVWEFDATTDPVASAVERLVYHRRQGGDPISLRRLLARAFRGNETIQSVDLGTGEGRFLYPMEEVFHGALPAAQINQMGTDNGQLNHARDSAFPDNDQFIREWGPESMDFVSLNAPFPDQRIQMLVAADALLKPNGLLFVTTGPTGFEKMMIPWLLARGYTVTLIAGMDHHPGYSIYEGDAEEGTLLASRTPLPIFEDVRSRGYAVERLAATAPAAPTGGALTHDVSRWVAGKLHLDPNGAAAEVAGAPIVEGATLMHFIPWFPLMHRTRSWHQWVGMAFIYGAAIGAAFAFGNGFTFDWASLLSAYFGGMVGHSAYNALARKFGWARLSDDDAPATPSSTPLDATTAGPPAVTAAFIAAGIPAVAAAGAASAFIAGRSARAAASRADAPRAPFPTRESLTAFLVPIVGDAVAAAFARATTLPTAIEALDRFAGTPPATPDVIAPSEPVNASVIAVASRHEDPRLLDAVARAFSAGLRARPADAAVPLRIRVWSEWGISFEPFGAAMAQIQTHMLHPDVIAHTYGTTDEKAQALINFGAAWQASSLEQRIELLMPNAETGLISPSALQALDLFIAANLRYNNQDPFRVIGENDFGTRYRRLAYLLGLPMTFETTTGEQEARHLLYLLEMFVAEDHFLAGNAAEAERHAMRALEFHRTWSRERALVRTSQWKTAVDAGELVLAHVGIGHEDELLDNMASGAFPMIAFSVGAWAFVEPYNRVQHTRGARAAGYADRAAARDWLVFNGISSYLSGNLRDHYPGLPEPVIHALTHCIMQALPISALPFSGALPALDFPKLTAAVAQGRIRPVRGYRAAAGRFMLTSMGSMETYKDLLQGRWNPQSMSMPPLRPLALPVSSAAPAVDPRVRRHVIEQVQAAAQRPLIGNVLPSRWITNRAGANTFHLVTGSHLDPRVVELTAQALTESFDAAKAADWVFLVEGADAMLASPTLGTGEQMAARVARDLGIPLLDPGVNLAHGDLVEATVRMAAQFNDPRLRGRTQFLIVAGQTHEAEIIAGLEPLINPPAPTRELRLGELEQELQRHVDAYNRDRRDARWKLAVPAPDRAGFVERAFDGDAALAAAWWDAAAQRWEERMTAAYEQELLPAVAARLNAPALGSSLSLSSSELARRRYHRAVDAGTWSYLAPWKRDEQLRQLFGALEPGGQFVTITPDQADPNNSYRWSQDTWRERLRAAGFDRLDIHPITAGNGKRFLVIRASRPGEGAAIDAPASVVEEVRQTRAQLTIILSSLYPRTGELTLDATLRAGRAIFGLTALALVAVPSLLGLFGDPIFLWGLAVTLPLSMGAAMLATSNPFLSMAFAPLWESLEHLENDFVERHRPATSLARAWLTLGQRKILAATTQARRNAWQHGGWRAHGRMPEVLAWWAGVRAHAAFNARPEPATAERATAESLVAFATSFAEGRAAGRSLAAVVPPVVNFQAGAAPGAPRSGEDFANLDLDQLTREIGNVMRERGGTGALADPTTARTVVRLFWMMGLRPGSAIPDGDLLFPDVASLVQALPGAPADRHAVLYVLATPAESAAIAALAAREKRAIRAVVRPDGFRAGGRLDFLRVEAALTSQLDQAELDKIRFVLGGGDIDALMALLATLPEGAALRRVRYLAVEALLSIAMPFNATHLIEMNAAAQALAARQA